MKTLKEVDFREKVLWIIKKDGTCSEITDFIESLFVSTLKEVLAEVMPEKETIHEDSLWSSEWNDCLDKIEQNIKTFFGGGEKGDDR